MQHELKIDPLYYDALMSGNKTFEIRYNDRQYQKGDALLLRPFWKKEHCYDSTRKEIITTITYVSTYNQKDGWCVLGIKLN